MTNVCLVYDDRSLVFCHFKFKLFRRLCNKKTNLIEFKIRFSLKESIEMRKECSLQKSKTNLVRSIDLKIINLNRYEIIANVSFIRYFCIQEKIVYLCK